MTKVAALQLNATDNLQHNLDTTAKLMQQAVQQGAQLIVLPEMFPLLDVAGEEKIKVAENFGEGPIQDFLATMAQKNKIWIVGGTIPLFTANTTKTRAACLIYNPHGVVVQRYDKMHLFDVEVSETEKYFESQLTEAGEAGALFETPFGKIGVAVCYDIRFPELCRYYFTHGAEILVFPSAFFYNTGKVHWDILTRARAIENLCYVVAANQTGTHAHGRKTYGHSRVIHPWGHVLNELPEGEGVAIADIDVQEVRRVRKNMPIDLHQRIKVIKE